MSEHDTRIKALAQELQDLILDFTLIASFQPTHRRVGVYLEYDARYDDPYKPPWQLSVDKRSRKEFATWYYSNNSFELPSWAPEGYDGQISEGDLLIYWLRSLPSDHRALLREIRIGGPEELQVVSTLKERLTVCASDLDAVQPYLAHVEETLEDEDMTEIRNNVIRTSVTVFEDSCVLAARRSPWAPRPMVIWVDAEGAALERQRLELLSRRLLEQQATGSEGKMNSGMLNLSLESGTNDRKVIGSEQGVEEQ